MTCSLRGNCSTPELRRRGPRLAQHTVEDLITGWATDTNRGGWRVVGGAGGGAGQGSCGLGRGTGCAGWQGVLVVRAAVTGCWSNSVRQRVLAHPRTHVNPRPREPARACPARLRARACPADPPPPARPAPTRHPPGIHAASTHLRPDPNGPFASGKGPFGSGRRDREGVGGVAKTRVCARIRSSSGIKAAIFGPISTVWRHSVGVAGANATPRGG